MVYPNLNYNKKNSKYTIQGFDFTLPFYENGRLQPQRTRYYDFAYLLKNKPIINTKKTLIRKNIDLVFVYGPNVAYEGSNIGSTKRTKIRNYKYPRDYCLFRKSVKTALKAGLIEMLLNSVQIAILSRISGGIYSGRGTPTNRKINSEYLTIIQEIVLENNLYFDLIILSV